MSEVVLLRYPQFDPYLGVRLVTQRPYTLNGPVDEVRVPYPDKAGVGTFCLRDRGRRTIEGFRVFE